MAITLTRLYTGTHRYDDGTVQINTPFIGNILAIALTTKPEYANTVQIIGTLYQITGNAQKAYDLYSGQDVIRLELPETDKLLFIPTRFLSDNYSLVIDYASVGTVAATPNSVTIPLQILQLPTAVGLIETELNGLRLAVSNTENPYFWNGTLWVSRHQFIGVASTNFANGGVINLISSGAIPLKNGYENQSIFLESMTYGLSVNGTVDTNNYYRLGAGVIRANGAVAAVDGSPTVDLLAVPTAQGTLDLNTLTTSYANNPATFFVAQFTKIGSGTNILTCQITFRYRLVAL